MNFVAKIKMSMLQSKINFKKPNHKLSNIIILLTFQMFGLTKLPVPTAVNIIQILTDVEGNVDYISPE